MKKFIKFNISLIENIYLVNSNPMTLNSGSKDEIVLDSLLISLLVEKEDIQMFYFKESTHRYSKLKQELHVGLRPELMDIIMRETKFSNISERKKLYEADATLRMEITVALDDSNIKDFEELCELEPGSISSFLLKEECA